MPESTFVLTVARAPNAFAFPTAMPTRHPAMLAILESELNSTATSIAPGTCSTEGAT